MKGCEVSGEGKFFCDTYSMYDRIISEELKKHNIHVCTTNNSVTPYTLLILTGSSHEKLYTVVLAIIRHLNLLPSNYNYLQLLICYKPSSKDIMLSQKHISNVIHMGERSSCHPIYTLLYKNTM